ncbi:MAG: DUF1553 domain-containing protein, partial [Candidatus Hydrogenedentes bacterium]|nr:DUF1553 domain-containing protein [Candidatus Hydrogenedentota bacterium]
QQLAMFLDSPAPDRRSRLVDHLLKKNQQYAEHWMTFWNDLLRNDFEGTGYIDGGREQITAWLYNALYENMPYDEFVTELIDPGAGANGFIKGIIWRGVVAAVQQPAVQAAQNVSQVFLGVNLKCASCHDSFIDHWKLADAYGLANAFSEEPMEMVRCEVPTGDMAEYKFLWDELGGIPHGTLEERRARVAELTTAKENGHFARTIVNRMWAKFLGRGFVEPLEGIEGQSWHPELLDWLAQDFIDHGYDLKHLMRRILTSQAYQMPSVAEAPDYTTDYVFKGPYPRRLSAEQFYDALATLTDTWLPTPKFPLPGVPEADQASQVRAWRTSADTLMRALGRPNREMVVSRRDSEATTLQLLELTHGHDLHAFIDRAAEKLAGGEEQAAELIRYLYEHGLQREPSAEELQIAQSMTGTPASPEGVEDLLWAFAMLPEFQYVY